MGLPPKYETHGGVFQITKHMAKLDGTVLFSGLFTVVNKWEQIRYQAFVPTKALENIKSGLSGIVTSLKHHSLAEPVLAFTDNIHADYATGVECIPSLRAGVVTSVESARQLPITKLPPDVTVIAASSFATIENACTCILANGEDGPPGGPPIAVGCKTDWQFRVGNDTKRCSRQTAWVIVAFTSKVYLFHVSQEPSQSSGKQSLTLMALLGP